MKIDLAALLGLAIAVSMSGDPKPGSCPWAFMLGTQHSAWRPTHHASSITSINSASINSASINSASISTTSTGLGGTGIGAASTGLGSTSINSAGLGSFNVSIVRVV